MLSEGEPVVLQIRDLRVSFNTFQLSVDDLDIPEGLTLLLGENGVGKTTLMRAVAGYLVPDVGMLSIDGHVCSRWEGNWGRLVTFVEDTLRVPKHLVLRDFLKLVASSFGDQWDVPLAGRLLNAFELSLNSEIGKLSRGMSTKAGIVAAAAACPTILLMDEPTAAMDPVARHGFLQIISSLAATGSSKAIMMSTHLLEDISVNPVRIVVISRGKVARVLSGTGLEDFIRLPVEEKIRDIAEWTNRNLGAVNA